MNGRGHLERWEYVLCKRQLGRYQEGHLNHYQDVHGQGMRKPKEGVKCGALVSRRSAPGDTKQRKWSTDGPTWNQFGVSGEVERIRNYDG
jgi:hypothetical protein